MSANETITPEVLAVAAITGTLGTVADRHLRAGLRRILQQAERGELPRNEDVAIAARRAQMLALRLSLRGHQRLFPLSSQITRPLSRFIHEALSTRKPEMDRSAQEIVFEAMEAIVVLPESEDGSARRRQHALRRLAEDWTLAEARARVRDAADWPQFEKLVREGDGRRDLSVATPAWWDAFRAFMAEEFKRDMRLASILGQPGLAEILGSQNALKAVLADMSNDQTSWFETIAPALPALRTDRERLRHNLERFDEIADQLAHTGSLVQRASEASDLGTLHLEAGRREEASSAIAEAVARYRELVARNRKAFLFNLATSLNQLAGLFANADALAAAVEAVGLYRELALENRVAVLPNLTRSLRDTSELLSSAGRDDEALAAKVEVVGLYRELVAKNPAIFLPELVEALNNWGRALAGAGRRDEALAAAVEAVGIYRELAARDREDFLPKLVRSLNYVAAGLSGAGLDGEALAAIDEVVDLNRQLVAKNRDAALPELAISLIDLERALVGAGRGDEALGTAAEVVSIYRELLGKDREHFLPDLAGSLSNLVRRFSSARRDEDALVGATELVDIYRELVAKNHDVFLPELARSLNNLASRLSNTGRADDALVASVEAVELARELFARDNDAYVEALARTCGSFGYALRALSRLDDAVRAFREGIETLTPIMAKTGDAHVGLFDALMNELIVTTEAAGRPQEATALRMQLNREPSG